MTLRGTHTLKSMEHRRLAPVRVPEARLGINWAKEGADGCEDAIKVHELVDQGSDGWVVQHDGCERCRLHTVVCHPADDVWCCLACGAHGHGVAYVVED